jgi:hypothetical protein
LQGQDDLLECEHLIGLELCRLRTYGAAHAGGEHGEFAKPPILAVFGG